MFLFIILSLGLCFVVQMASSLQSVLISPVIIYAGVFLAAVSILGIIIKKGSIKIWHDLFAGGALLAWFAYWQTLFNDDSPIFFFFPLYFVFLGAFIEISALAQRQPIDDETFRRMQALTDHFISQPWVLMLAVLVTLELPQHYLLYPVMMTLLMIRFALFRYLQRS